MMRKSLPAMPNKSEVGFFLFNSTKGLCVVDETKVKVFFIPMDFYIIVVRVWHFLCLDSPQSQTEIELHNTFPHDYYFSDSELNGRIGKASVRK